MKKKGLSKIELQAVKEFSTRLRDSFPREVEAIKLYGSKARKASTKESDIDLLIIVKKRTSKIDDTVIDLVCDILNEFGVFIETVTLESAVYSRAKAHQYPFAINVEKDAIIL